MFFQTNFFFFVFPVFFIIPFLWLFWSKPKKLPPSPSKLPVIGNLHLIGRLPHKSLLNLSRKHGDLMFLQLGSIPTLIVSSPKAAKNIFMNHDLAFSGRPILYSANNISYNSSNISFAPYGEYWREVRKVAVTELFNTKRVESFAGIRAEEVSIMIDQIKRENSSVNLSSLSVHLANAVICRVSLGRKNDRSFERIMTQVQHLVAEFNIADYFPVMSWINKVNGVVDSRIKKIMKEIESFFNNVITEHRAKIDNETQDFVDVLLRIQKDQNRSVNLSDHQIIAVLIDVFFAGTDTASATIEWTMAELMRNPETRHKAQQEIRRIGGKQEAIQEKDLSKLTYLKQVIKESLRVHPPAPLLIPRETIEDCIIDDEFEIPVKTRVIVNVSALSIDPEYWEKPEIFSPERFDDNGVDFRGRNFEFLPFGAGRRG